MEQARPTQMFIVARRHPELYDYLSAQFAGDPSVTVVLDRRLASRRRRALAAAAERRRTDRRWRPEVDEQLRATPLAIVTAATTFPAPPRATPASEARQWIEALHRGVKAVHSALDEHERLQIEAQSIKQDHSRLETDAQTLRLENDRLRAEISRSGRELAALDHGLGQALEVVTDLRSRLNKAPDRYPAE